MARLTLAEFLGTYPAEREFTPSLGPSTTVGAFFDRLSAEEKALEITYRGNEEGVFVFIDGLESARLGRVSWPTGGLFATLAAFLSTFPADRPFIRPTGQRTTVGAFLADLPAKSQTQEVTHRATSEGMVVLSADQSWKFGTVERDTAEPIKPEGVPAPTDAPTETAEPPTEPTAPTAGTVHIPAPYRWAMGYSAKLGAVETHYHAWQFAIDAQRKYRGTDEAKKTVLRARVAELKLMWNAVRSDLYAWVVAHPAPEGTAELD